MDGDPGVESEIDSFSLVLPLPYRVAIIIVLGIVEAGATCDVERLTSHQAFGHGVSICTIFISSELYVWLLLRIRFQLTSGYNRTSQH